MLPVHAANLVEKSGSTASDPGTPGLRLLDCDIVNLTRGPYLNQDAEILIEEKECQNIARKMVAIFFRSQCVGLTYFR